MPDYSAELGFDAARLERQVTFLQDRAEWHRRRETPLDLATAAALQRDAGLVALLLGKVALARRELEQAGTAMNAIGLFSGYLLWRLAGTDRVYERLDIDSIDRMADDVRRGGGADSDRSAPFEGASAQSPRQLLSLYQAFRGGRRRDDRTAPVAEAAAARLSGHAGLTVGLTAMPVLTYVPVFDRCGADEMAHRDHDTIFAASVRRREMIEAAQTDGYHWRMLLQPAELVDLDMMALGLNAMEAEGESRSWMMGLAERLGPVAALPFLLARDLHEAPGEEPRPRAFGG